MPFEPFPSSPISSNPAFMASAVAATPGGGSLTGDPTAGLNTYMSLQPPTGIPKTIGEAAAQYDANNTTEAVSGFDLTPELDKDARFQWQEVEPITLNYQKFDYNVDEYNIAETNQFNEMESRVYALDMWRAGSDTPSDIGSFRVIAYEFGQINTKKQIFPKLQTRYAFDVGYDQSSVRGLLYKKMIIASMSFGYAERSQIIKSNKALHAYFFNDSPEVISIQGFLKTSSTDPWDIAMVLLWDRLLRGTELARHNGILEIAIADVVYWGYPLSFTYQISANTQFVASFAMQLLVIDKLLPLQNLDDAVMELVTAKERNDGFVTTSKSTTNDLTAKYPMLAPESPGSVNPFAPQDYGAYPDEAALGSEITPPLSNESIDEFLKPPATVG